MKRTIALALLLGGCIDPQAAAERAFPAYRQKPIELAIIRLGPPEQTVKRPGGDVLTWSSKSDHPPMFCRLEVHTDDKDLIMGIRHRGNPGECMKLYQLLQ